VRTMQGSHAGCPHTPKRYQSDCCGLAAGQVALGCAPPVLTTMLELRGNVRMNVALHHLCCNVVVTTCNPIALLMYALSSLRSFFLLLLVATSLNSSLLLLLYE